MTKAVILAFLVFLPSVGLAQGAIPVTFQSAEVQPDNSVIFRYRDTGAHQVLLLSENLKAPIPMIRHKGIWSAHMPPMPPDSYWYTFIVDGQPMADPLSHTTPPNPVYLSSRVRIPSKTPVLWEATDVPHGEVHHHFYQTKIALGLPGGQSDYYVYTPPGYDRAGKPYPVLYLLHGYSDKADDWTTIGGANFILDSLIAAGKAKPMIVVMPLGYGDASLINGDWASRIGQNNALYTRVLLEEIIPQIQTGYHVSAERNDRAIAGLSMGGLQSLDIGLNHSDQFAWIGGFSPADFLSFGHRPAIDGGAANLKLLWIACGTDDTLIQPTRATVSALSKQNYKITAVETPGAHAWVVWHDNLIHFAPLLFQDAN